MNFNRAARQRWYSFGATVSLGLMMLLSTSPAWSQATSNASVSGLVSDASKGAIPGAEVRLFDATTSSTQTTKTNDAGRYVFSSVPSATYVVTITKDGFNTFKVDALKVDIGSQLTVNAVLQVGSTATTIEVTALAGVELQTANAAVGVSLTGAVLQELPNMGRDVSTLAVLQPGTTLGGYTAGSYNDQNTYQIDGGNASDDMAGNTTGYQTNFTGLGGTQTSGAPSGVIPTPVESIEEFKVNTFNQTADFNNSIGGQVQMATKRGQNQFHGSGYFYYFATNVGAANSWAADHTPSAGLPYTPLPVNHRDRFGSSLGGPMLPKLLGGKTYFFFNYEGLRFPNVSTYERTVPTDMMRAGIIQVPNSAGVYTAFNLNPSPKTVNGVQYPSAVCPNGSCDPRGVGLNPIVDQLWSKYMPHANDFSGGTGDTYNTAGYLSTIRAPLTSNVYISRVDHDFGEKWRWMTSYRYMRLINQTTNQVDIGGFFTGDTFGQPAAVAPRPQLPSYFVTGLTTTITSNIVNDFRLSYLRNFWQWGDQNSPPQLPGLGGALEIAPGNSTSAESTTALIPYNVNTQSTRQRFWDGHDTMLRDDVTWIKGKHVINFGGAYQRNFDYHQRTDNGVGINNQIVYQITSANIAFPAAYQPTGLPSSSLAIYNNLYAEVLGMVGLPQVAFTRSGNNLALQPVGSAASDKSTIPYYDGYISDSWKLKPSLTLVYSLGYTLEMPPTEQTGKQVVLVDPSGNPVITQDYLNAKKAAALAGQTYNPALGFALVGNVAGGGRKYPYDPFYGEWSPRVSVAWNPHVREGLLGKLVGDGTTVIRGGYSRIYGRLNGVNQVLTPLLGVGLIQATSCPGASKAGTCLGSGNVDPTSAFRIGVDGLTAPIPAPSATLSQPYYPGVGGNSTVGDTTTLDPHYRPQKTDNFTLSIQRQINAKMIIEAGYIGRKISNETMETDLDAVPYMYTLGGQNFAQAYSQVYTALNNGTAAGSVASQPFFESALGGTNSAFCKGFSSCTTALLTSSTTSSVAAQLKNAQVSDVWAKLNTLSSWVPGRTMISGAGGQATSMEMVNSLGYGNYNALYVTWRARDYHHATIISNFTYGRSIGTATLGQYNSSYTQMDAFNINANKGPNSFDIKFLYNLAMTYETPWFKGNKGILGRTLYGWRISPLFTAQSGAPIAVGYAAGSQTQAFGQSSSSAINTNNWYGTDTAVLAASTFTGGNSAHYNVAGSNGVGTNNPTGVNLFADPAAVAAQFRKCILGIDTSCGGYGNLRGLPTYNMDASISKTVGIIKDKVSGTLSFQFTNILNHVQPSNPGSLSLTSLSTFGRITGQSNTPRNLEFGLRLFF